MSLRFLRFKAFKRKVRKNHRKARKGSSSRDDVSDPGLHRLPQLAQSAFEEMIGAFDQHKLLWLGKRKHYPHQFAAWPVLVTVAADE
jgi:hypothetical protein